MSLSSIDERPGNFDRRHAVSREQEAEWQKHLADCKAAGIAPIAPLRGQAKPGEGVFRRVMTRLGSAPLWVPYTTQKYAAILDHGIRSSTRGIVIHVNDGSFNGTINFFTNGLREPFGSEGVGAHFEFGGKIDGGLHNRNQIVQFLPLDRVAWHAVNANGNTIGFEHAGWGYTLYEWETQHAPMIANSAYRAAWILRRFGLGPPVYSENPNVGNIWPHHAGGLSWGGHICPNSSKDGRDYFPWQLWLDECKKAYRNKWPEKHRA